jgi:DNA-binding HxlR family transcriptional regulator
LAELLEKGSHQGRGRSSSRPLHLEPAVPGSLTARTFAAARSNPDEDRRGRMGITGVDRYWSRPVGFGNLKGVETMELPRVVTIRRHKASETFDAKFPARRLLDLIGDKWTPIVLYCLSGGVRRFNEMQRQIPDISKKVLIQVLRSLERDGLVERTVYPVVPPKTEYRLTEDGKRLHAPVAALCAWAIKNDVFLDAVFARRDRSAP